MKVYCGQPGCAARGEIPGRFPAKNAGRSAKLALVRQQARELGALEGYMEGSNEGLEEVAEQPAREAIASKPRSRAWIILAVAVIALLGIWFLVRPGVFTVQPIGAIPEGVTIIYHSRGPEMPVFSSPDGLCLQMQGSVSLLCRGAALAGGEQLLDREILRLPYSHSAYLRSTGGMEFDR